MIGFTPHDGDRTVELLCKNRSNHLMRESHLRKGQLGIGPGIEVGGESVSAADHEDQVPGPPRNPLLQPAGEVRGAELPAALVEEHDLVRRPQGLEDEPALAGLDLLAAQGRDVLQFRDLLHLEGNVVYEPGHIHVQSLLDPLDVGLSYGEQSDPHQVRKYFRKDSNVAQYLQ